MAEIQISSQIQGAEYLPENVRQERLREFQQQCREEQREIYGGALMPRVGIDPRILAFESQLQDQNRHRAESLGRRYEDIDVIYVNRQMAFALDSEIKYRHRLYKQGEYDHEESDHFSVVGRYIVIYVHNFLPRLHAAGEEIQTYKDIDAYYAAYALRHEMGHGGSYLAYNISLNATDQVILHKTQSGIHTYNFTTRRHSGRGLNEGNQRKEDMFFLHGIGSEYFLNTYGSFSIDDILPRGREAFEFLRNRLITTHTIKRRDALHGYQRGFPQCLRASKDYYQAYVTLITHMCTVNPDIAPKIYNCIYGGDVLSLEECVEQTFGYGTFAMLLAINNPTDAEALLGTFSESVENRLKKTYT